MKKILLVVLDGLGDRKNDVLGGLTPLQAAYRPNLNELVRRGMGGLMYPVQKGLVCGSDTSHLSLLGYDPREVYTGRGPFEAIGLGIDVRPGDIAFRANFATRSSGGNISDRRAGRFIPGSDRLARSICMKIEGVEFIVKEGVEHRAALVMRGDGLSPEVTDSDPHVTGLQPKRVAALSEKAQKTANVLNSYLEKVREILDSHEVNGKRTSDGDPAANELLVRGAGAVPYLEPFPDRYRVKAACLAGVPLITGIAKLAGLDLLKFGGATGTVNTDYIGKIHTVITALEKYDFVLLNIKATDIAGHDKSPELKRDVIQKIDYAIRPLLSILDETVICITGDHSTPASSGEHSGDPLPVLFASYGILSNGVRQFDEVSCSQKSLSLLSGDIMNMLLQLSDRLEKYGA